MQIFDRKYRLFGIINLIDLIVIVAVLVGGFAVYRLLSHSRSAETASTGQDFTYTVLCPTLRGVTAQQIKVGDTIFYKNNGKPIGTVKAVRATPLPGEFWDVQTNSMKRYQSTIYSDIWIDAAVKGTATPTGFMLGDVLLHGGQPLAIMTSTFDCDTALITTMTAVGQ
ncbi:MAG TPA: DUF4330 domain-containing protein [Coriobacteriia bacterium]